MYTLDNVGRASQKREVTRRLKLDLGRSIIDVDRGSGPQLTPPPPPPGPLNFPKHDPTTQLLRRLSYLTQHSVSTILPSVRDTTDLIATLEVRWKTSLCWKFKRNVLDLITGSVDAYYYV